MTASQSSQFSLQYAKAVRDCISENAAVTKSLAELGLVNAKVFVIHEKGTDNHQVNVSFDLAEGDNIEGVARKFGIGLIPMMIQQLQKDGVMEKPATEFFCIPQSPEHQKDAVVATFLFNGFSVTENIHKATGTIQPPLN
ncbi:MAG: hypothetical protein K2Q32_06140 [Alphaproteobacteria bacterium]|nr:hypothetical protein [Alphaproteobacteria bacterium]